MYGIFDSHAHYDDEAFQEDRDALLQSLPKQGICGVINCASDLPTALESIALAQKYSFVFAAAGIHPHEAAKAPADWYEQLCALIENPKVVAVGEIGLDYHYDFSPRDLQKQLLIKQLALAKDCGLPVILHDREAHGDMMEILRKARPKGVMHCFSGSVELMRETVALGMYIGLGGATTFKNARVPVEVAKEVPFDRLLLETDCPYMTPVPFRGKRNDSAFIPLTAEKIAAERGIDAQTLVDQCRKNTCALFGIPESSLLYMTESERQL